jgi:hypothetical protein
MITAEVARQNLKYDPETGEFVRLRYGSRAGSIDRYGYLTIGVARRYYFAHRLAWLMVYGDWPSDEIDHINGDPLDNRIANLRLATRSQNLANTKASSRNTSGFKGVAFSKKAGRWQAYICKDQKQKHLGYFDSPEAAHAAYLSAAEQCFGVYARAA